jgi:hypothetical protein
MKWNDHLKDSHDKGFEAGKDYSDKTNLAATIISSAILAVAYNTDWKKIKRKLRKLFR